MQSANALNNVIMSGEDMRFFISTSYNCMANCTFSAIVPRNTIAKELTNVLKGTKSSPVASNNVNNLSKISESDSLMPMISHELFEQFHLQGLD